MVIYRWPKAVVVPPSRIMVTPWDLAWCLPTAEGTFTAFTEVARRLPATNQRSQATAPSSVVRIILQVRSFHVLLFNIGRMCCFELQGVSGREEGFFYVQHVVFCHLFLNTGDAGGCGACERCCHLFLHLVMLPTSFPHTHTRKYASYYKAWDVVTSSCTWWSYPPHFHRRTEENM
jgi:hypothetical protein